MSDDGMRGKGSREGMGRTEYRDPETISHSYFNGRCTCACGVYGSKAGYILTEPKRTFTVQDNGEVTLEKDD